MMTLMMMMIFTDAKILYILELTVSFDAYIPNNSYRKAAKYSSLINDLSPSFSKVVFIDLSMGAIGFNYFISLFLICSLLLFLFHFMLCSLQASQLYITMYLGGVFLYLVKDIFSENFQILTENLLLLLFKIYYSKFIIQNLLLLSIYLSSSSSCLEITINLWAVSFCAPLPPCGGLQPWASCHHYNDFQHNHHYHHHYSISTLLCLSVFPLIMLPGRVHHWKVYWES